MERVNITLSVAPDAFQHEVEYIEGRSEPKPNIMAGLSMTAESKMSDFATAYPGKSHEEAKELYGENISSWLRGILKDPANKVTFDEEITNGEISGITFKIDGGEPITIACNEESSTDITENRGQGRYYLEDACQIISDTLNIAPPEAFVKFTGIIDAKRVAAAQSRAKTGAQEMAILKNKRLANIAKKLCETPEFKDANDELLQKIASITSELISNSSKVSDGKRASIAFGLHQDQVLLSIIKDNIGDSLRNLSETQLNLLEKHFGISEYDPVTVATAHPASARLMRVNAGTLLDAVTMKEQAQILVVTLVGKSADNPSFTPPQTAPRNS